MTNFHRFPFFSFLFFFSLSLIFRSDIAGEISRKRYSLGVDERATFHCRASIARVPLQLVRIVRSIITEKAANDRVTQPRNEFGREDFAKRVRKRSAGGQSSVLRFPSVFFPFSFFSSNNGRVFHRFAARLPRPRVFTRGLLTRARSAVRAPPSLRNRSRDRGSRVRA